MPTVESYIAENEGRFLEELKEFLQIPSISALPESAQDVARCASWLADHIRAIGFTGVQVLPTGGHPVVYGEWMGAPGQPTALLYGHYDVQPVDPIDLWDHQPFDPQVKDGKLFARGSSDDKGQLFLHLKAVEAHLKVNGWLPVNLKLLFEGEEEVGSENLDRFLEANKELLKADVSVISDGNWLDKDSPSVSYGVRGLTYLEVRVKGADSDLHSGGFGGAVGNPIQALAEMIAGLKDSHGRITVPGFYDSVKPISEAEKTQLGSLPFDEEKYRGGVGVPALFPEEGYTIVESSMARPTLDVNGIWGGFAGEGTKTVLPGRAGAKISCRLVPDQDPEEIGRLVEARLKELCPPYVEIEVALTGTAKPAMAPPDHPAVQAAARAVEKAFHKKVSFIRMGGTIPVVASLQSMLGLPVVLMALGLPDCRAHAPNERFDLGNFYGGIRASAFLWDELAGTKG